VKDLVVRTDNASRHVRSAEHVCPLNIFASNLKQGTQRLTYKLYSSTGSCVLHTDTSLFNSNGLRPCAKCSGWRKKFVRKMLGACGFDSRVCHRKHFIE